MLNPDTIMVTAQVGCVICGRKWEQEVAVLTSRVTVTFLICPHCQIKSAGTTVELDPAGKLLRTIPAEPMPFDDLPIDYQHLRPSSPEQAS